MLFKVTGRSTGGVTEVRLEHNGEEIIFPAQGYTNAKIHDPLNMFVDINKYLAGLPKDTQDDLFKLYQDAYNVVDNFTDVRRLPYNLRVIIRCIGALINIDDIRTQLMLKPGWKLPSTINKDYTPDNLAMENYRSRTYLADNYYDLAALATAYRLVMPFWGWLMWLTKKEVGSRYKEDFANSITVNTVFDTYRGARQLRDFIFTNTGSGNDDLPIASIMGGMSSDDLADHLTSLVIVRKLAIEPIDNHHNLVSIVYNYVTGTKTRIEARFKGNVRVKPVSNSDRSDDDNSAVTDAWKLTEKISDGTRSPYIVYCQDVERIMRHATRTNIEDTTGNYDAKKLAACMANFDKMLTADIHPHQTALIMWVLTRDRKTMTAPAITILDKRSKLTMAMATQSLLWEWGFNELAALMVVEKPPEDRNIFPVRESTKQVPVEIRAKLNELYPYYRTDNGREVVTDNPNRRPNEAIRAIDLVFNYIAQDTWMLYGPEDLNATLPLYRKEFPYTASGNIRLELANLILHINGVTKDA